MDKLPSPMEWKIMQAELGVILYRLENHLIHTGEPTLPGWNAKSEVLMAETVDKIREILERR